MRIILDRSRCTGLGICESVAPELFEVDENGDLVVRADVVPEGQLNLAEQAARGCPTEALRLEE